MLVLTVKSGGKVTVENTVIHNLSKRKVKWGFEAPDDVSIVRDEAVNQQPNTSDPVDQSEKPVARKN
jgi:sRNA-binding carbon storage regulator CsrA